MNIKIHKIKGLSTIDYRKLTNLQGDLKTLNTENKTKLINVLKRRGFRAPVFVYEDKGGSIYLMDGHQRQAVMLSNDMNDDGSYEVPYVPIYAKDIQEAQAILLEITSQYGTLTQAGLDKYMTLAQLPVAETMEMVNFDSLHIPTDQEDAVESPDVVEDEAPEVSDNPPVSKLGEIYQLGRHRVMCGSAVDDNHLAMLLANLSVDMVYTDPPYGMFLDTDFSSMDGLSPDGKSFLGTKGGKVHKKVAGDAEDFDPEFIYKVFSSHPNCKEIFLWGADYYADILSTRNDGSWVVWDKRTNEGATEEQADSADKLFGSNFELCWSKAKHKREIARIRNGIFGVKNEAGNSSTVHPTQKPVQLASWFFNKWGNNGDIVADHFLGSGSTLIACEQTDRTCYGMELDPKYVDVIRKRYHRYVAGSDEGWEDATQAI